MDLYKGFTKNRQTTSIIVLRIV